jgi:hypothetical protein
MLTVKMVSIFFVMLPNKLRKNKFLIFNELVPIINSS